MLDNNLYQEEYHINPVSFDPGGNDLQIYCSFVSTWKPGFISPTGGGQYAVYALVKEGIYRIFYENNVKTVSGTCFYHNFSREVYHRAQVVGDKPLVRKVILLYRNSFLEMLSSHFFSHHGQLCLTDPEKAEVVFDLIHEELGRKNPDQSRLAGLFMQLLHEVSSQQYQSQYPEQLDELMSFITVNLDNPDLCREMIADNCHVSIRTMSRIFSEQLGISVGRYINNCRMEKVCGMLALPGLTIKEIARRCGFSSAGFLTGSFRKKFGMSPKQYRQKLAEHE